MNIRDLDLSQRDWELCQQYLEQLIRKGVPAHEPWENDLESWAANRKLFPRKSTIARLRLRFPTVHDRQMDRP